MQPEQKQRVVDDMPDDYMSKEYSTADAVWIWIHSECCTAALQPGVVTKVNLPQLVEADGVLWNVRDLRHHNCTSLDDASPPDVPETDDEPPRRTSKRKCSSHSRRMSR